MTRHYTCAYCGREATLTDVDFDEVSGHLFARGVSGGALTAIEGFRCPSPKCRNLSLIVKWQGVDEQEPTNSTGVSKLMATAKQFVPMGRGSRVLVPRPGTGDLPPSVPEVLKEDYLEARAVLPESPKASATLARRCLQGMIRDFWGIKKRRLKDEVDALKGRVQTEVWKAIDSVRSVGNIGAHMERDVNLIVEVEPGEAEKLLELIRMLMKDWYQGRAEREALLASVQAIGASKSAAKTAAKQTGPAAQPGVAQPTTGSAQPTPPAPNP